MNLENLKKLISENIHLEKLTIAENGVTNFSSVNVSSNFISVTVSYNKENAMTMRRGYYLYVSVQNKNSSNSTVYKPRELPNFKFFLGEIKRNSHSAKLNAFQQVRDVLNSNSLDEILTSVCNSLNNKIV